MPFLGHRVGDGANTGLWYGQDDAKWNALSELASQQSIDVPPGADQDPFLRGLIEWRLATTWVQRDLGTIDPARWVEFRYEDLVRAPGRTMERVLAGVELPSDPSVLEVADQRVRDRPRRHAPLPPEAAAVAGGLLADLHYDRWDATGG
jgi:hypothetical protein